MLMSRCVEVVFVLVWYSCHKTLSLLCEAKVKASIPLWMLHCMWPMPRTPVNMQSAHFYF